ncbi:MAG: hypothetical protein ACLFRT_15380, partial [Actinomycetota bacterium]
MESLVRSVETQRFTTVVGPSGSGKSSLVRAGLLPALMNGAIDGSGKWLHVVLTPGPHPMESLAASLETLAARPMELFRLLHTEGLGTTVERLLEGLEGDLVIVIDQFEELFTLVRDPVERKAFVDLLVDVVESSATRVRVVTTLRSDLYDGPLSEERLGHHVRDGQVTVLRPTSDEVVEMIVSPADGAGLHWEPGLPERIAHDVADQPGGLPLLQYALTEMVENRQTDHLHREDYERIGGVAGALAGRAETIYHQLEPRLQEKARDILLRLVTVDENARDTRRRVRWSELESLGMTRVDLDRIVTPFVTERLLLADRDPTTRGPTVEVAHEALLREWPRLRRWIEEERDTLIVTRKLRAAMQEWETAGRHPDYLPTGSQLVPLQTLLEKAPLAADERAFLETSLERDRVARRTRQRRRRILAGVLATVTVAAVMLAGVAINQTRKAEARELAASVINVLDKDPELSLLLAVEAATRAEPDFETISALHEALYHHRLLWTVNWSGNSDFLTGALSPDGTRLALSGAGRIEVWNVDTDSLMWELDVPADLRVTPFFSRDGSELVGLMAWPRLSPLWESIPPGVKPGVYRWAATTGEQLGYVTGGECPIWDIAQFGPSIDPSKPVLVAGFAANATGEGCDHSLGTVSLLDLETGSGTPLAEIGIGDYRSSLSTSEDGRYVSFVESRVASIVDTTTGEEIVRSPTDVWSATLSADGSSAVLRENSGALSIMDVDNSPSIRQLSESRGERVQFEGAGTRFAHHDFDGRITIFDLESARAIGRLVAGPGRDTRLEMGALTMSYSFDGTRLASFANDGSARVWSTAP